MTSQQPFGLFKYVPSVSQGDPYSSLEKTGRAPKSAGKQFQTNGLKKGKTPEVYFNPAVTTSVYVGSKYSTLAEQDRRYQISKKQRQIVPTPFKPSTPSNTMEGLGSYYGSFSKWENLKTSNDFDKRPRTKGDTSFSPRNFLTNPPKKGHVGLLGCRSGPQGIVNEYKYEANPEPPGKGRDHVTPFKPSSPAKKGLFSQDCHVTFTPLAYSSEGPREVKRRDGDPPKPWSPANVKISKGPAGRIYGTVNPFPEYVDHGPNKKILMRGQDGKRLGPVFYPSTTPKTMRSPSIANMRRNYTQPF